MSRKMYCLVLAIGVLWGVFLGALFGILKRVGVLPEWASPWLEGGTIGGTFPVLFMLLNKRFCKNTRYESDGEKN